MEIPDELNALLAAMKLSSEEPAWKFSASTDQVTVQLTSNKAKEPEASSSKSKPALKNNKPSSTRRIKGLQVLRPVDAITSLEGSREIIPTKYQGKPEGIVIKTEIVISPFNPRKACHRQYYLQPTSDRGKRCRIDYDEGFDLDDPEILRIPPHTSPLVMPSPGAVAIALTIFERPDTPYYTHRCKVKAKRSSEVEPHNR
ncbi:unnamed protein product [Mytilus edulis]|uniref:Uncharacterized protein n=1 Tax=Mytilus edulis TaxID=6550 RepID=A0A8S3TNT3_MYTED|nr:unnamed protein product [Mytilus edulis]